MMRPRSFVRFTRLFSGGSGFASASEQQQLVMAPFTRRTVDQVYDQIPWMSSGSPIEFIVGTAASAILFGLGISTSSILVHWVEEEVERLAKWKRAKEEAERLAKWERAKEEAERLAEWKALECRIATLEEEYKKIMEYKKKMG